MIKDAEEKGLISPKKVVITFHIFFFINICLDGRKWRERKGKIWRMRDPLFG